MRVITGSAKGKRLVTPDGKDVRPTPDKVKEGLFSALQIDIEGRRILDLFARTRTNKDFVAMVKKNKFI